MNSVSSWLKCTGIGGQLAPFFKSVCVYFVALSVGGDTPSARAVAFKCAPVLSLLAAVGYRFATLPHGQGRYCGLVCAGLALSAVGDAVLVWPGQEANGMAAFAGAHLAYITALGLTPPYGKLGAALGLYSAAGLYLTLISPPGVFRVLVPMYAALIATTAWRAIVRGGAAAPAAAMLLLSDAVLGYELFSGPVPLRHLLVMPPYYLGQLGLAYSALRHTGDAQAPKLKE